MSSTEAAGTSKSNTKQNSTTNKKRNQTLDVLWSRNPRPPPLTPIDNLPDNRKRSTEETPTNPLPGSKKARRELFVESQFPTSSQSDIASELVSAPSTDREAPIPINSSFSSETSSEISPRAFPSGPNLTTYQIVTPRSLPDSIPKNRRNEYIQTVAERQVDLWNFEEHLEELDLRSPLLSSLSSDSVLLSSLLQKVSHALKNYGVKEIDSVQFPDMHIDSSKQLLEVLQGFLGQDDTEFEMHKFYVTAIRICIDVPKLTTIRGKADDFTKLFVARNVKKIRIESNNDTLNTFFQKIERELHDSSSLADFACEMHGPTQEEPLTPKVLQHSTQVHQQYILPFSSVVQLSPRSSRDANKTGTIILPHANGESENHHFLTHDLKIASHEYPSHGIDPLTEQLGLARFREFNIDGRGIHIAFLTSGILRHHLAFRGAINELHSFVPSEESDLTVDELGYGTMCASVAGGRSFDYPVSANSSQSDLESHCLGFPPGVAPGTKLTILEVTSAASSQADPTSVVEALEYIIDIHKNGKPVNIVCIPMGSTSYNRKLQNRISSLQRLGIIIVTAAGNTARNGIAYPAHCGGTLCIGACDANGARMASTPIGQELDFLAPGLNICCAGTSTAGLWEVSYVTGSSCACAAVAGVVAVVLQYIRDVEETKDLFEKIDTHVIKELLKSASTHQTHHSEKDGYGSLDLTRFPATRPQEIRQKVLKIISPD